MLWTKLRADKMRILKFVQAQENFNTENWDDFSSFLSTSQ